jgi:hypothetical protein
MQDLWAALGLVLVIEGALYALFPAGMISMMRRLPEVPPAALRVAGILSVALGWLIVRLVRN